MAGAVTRRRGALGLRRRGHRHAGRRRVRAAYAAAAAVSSAPAELAVALSFFDPDAGIHGTVRSGLTLLFEGREARAERGPVEIERAGDGWQARASGDVDVKLDARSSDTADLGGIAVRCAASRAASAARRSRGLGTAAETRRAARVARARSAARDLGRVRARAGGARGRAPPAGSRGARQRAGHRRRWSRAASCARPRTRASRRSTTAAGASTARARALVPGRGLPAAAVRHRSGGHVARARGTVRPRRGVQLADGGPRRRRALRAHAAARGRGAGGRVSTGRRSAP